LAPRPAGGKGAPAIDWWVGDDCPAEIYALADISTRRVWLFTKDEFRSRAQQNSGGRHHLYMYTDPQESPLAYARHGDQRFSDFLFDSQIVALFRSV
jgi:hypothetical protein